MPNQVLPEKYQKLFQVSTVNEMWLKLLNEGDPMARKYRHLYGLIPSNPRCAACNAPFAGLGGILGKVGLVGSPRSHKNPRFCNACESFNTAFPGGAEVNLTMLFVDVRGSTTIAERMPAAEFSQLMNRFYAAVIEVLIHADAFIDKLVGDEVTALFIPGYAGKQHALKAVKAGQAMLQASGYGEPGGAWVPVGVGIHTGTAWVGTISGANREAADYTALGDNVNIAARLASLAGPGEILASEAACVEAGLDTDPFEQRELSLKGKSETVCVRVLNAQSAELQTVRA